MKFRQNAYFIVWCDAACYLSETFLHKQARVHWPLRVKSVLCHVIKSCWWLLSVKGFYPPKKGKAYVNHECNFLMFMLRASFHCLTEWQLVNDMNREQQNSLDYLCAASVLLTLCFLPSVLLDRQILVFASITAVFGSLEENCTNLCCFTAIHTVWKGIWIFFNWAENKKIKNYTLN